MTAVNLRRLARGLEDLAEVVRDIARATWTPSGRTPRRWRGRRVSDCAGFRRVTIDSLTCLDCGGAKDDHGFVFPGVFDAEGKRVGDREAGYDADPPDPARPLDAPPLPPTCAACGDFESDHFDTGPRACFAPGCTCAGWRAPPVVSSTPLPLLSDGARDPRDRSPCNCVTCGKPVEEARLCYAHPTCYACLPPPPPLEIAPPGLMRATMTDAGLRLTPVDMGDEGEPPPTRNPRDYEPGDPLCACGNPHCAPGSETGAPHTFAPHPDTRPDRATIRTALLAMPVGDTNGDVRVIDGTNVLRAGEHRWRVVGDGARRGVDRMVERIASGITSRARKPVVPWEPPGRVKIRLTGQGIAPSMIAEWLPIYRVETSDEEVRGRAREGHFARWCEARKRAEKPGGLT